MHFSKATIFVTAYVIALGTLLWAGYYFYADYTMNVDVAQRVLKQKEFSTDLSYVDLPRVNVTLVSAREAREGHVIMDISLEVDTRYVAKIEGLRPRMSDRLRNYTESIDFDDLAKPDAITVLRPDILEIINKISRPVNVRDIIFRKYLVF